MNAEQLKHYQSLQRGVELVKSFASSVPEVVATPSFVELAELMDAIPATTVERYSGHRERSSRANRKRELRKVVEAEFLNPLRTLAEAYDEYQLLHIALRQQIVRLNDHKFVVACTCIAGFSESFEEKLVRHGMRAGFVEALRTCVAEYDRLTLEVGMGRIQSGTQTMQIAIKLRRAQVLSDVVGAQLRATGALTAQQLGAWRSALLHAERPAKRLVAPRRLALPAPGPQDSEEAESHVAGQAGTFQRLVSRAKHLLPGTRASGEDESAA